MLWLCQITFAGVGALTTAQLATEHGWNLIVAIVAGGVVAAAIGVIIGLLTIRLGNLYVALVTLTFGLLMETLVFTLDTFAQFGTGLPVQRPTFAVSDTRVHVLSCSACSRSSRCSSSTCGVRPPVSR